MKEKRVAVVTGATSGIGAAFARRLAGSGYDLVITGRREQVIHSLAAEIREAHSVGVTVVLVELAEKRDVEKLVRVIDGCDAVEVLVNNAGFGHRLGFFEDDFAGQARMIAVHNQVAALLVHAVVPAMKRRGRGAIINVSSLMAFFPLPGSEIYSSTKAFLKMFSESLALTLHGQNIRVQALCPGLTRTDFHERIDLDSRWLRNRGLLRWMHPDRVARISLRALEGKRVVVIPGILNRLLVCVIRLIPGRVYRFFAARITKL